MLLSKCIFVMLIGAIVGNQIKMLNTAAKQSPGKDANSFMLITQVGRKKMESKIGRTGEKKKKGLLGDGG